MERKVFGACWLALNLVHANAKEALLKKRIKKSPAVKRQKKAGRFAL